MTSPASLPLDTRSREIRRSALSSPLTSVTFNRSSEISNTQSQIDGLSSGFVREATNWQTLAAMMTGGVFYRLGRAGAMSTLLRATGRSPLQGLVANGIGLAAEVTAFELTDRSLLILSGDTLPPNLFHWSGGGGFAEGWRSSFVRFGTLRLVGTGAAGQNLIVQHALQDGAMVAGNHLCGRLGWMLSPEGDLAGQLLQAEAVNLQLGGADAFAQVLTRGRLRALERSLELSSPSASPSTDSFLTRFSRTSRERGNTLTDFSAKWVASGVGIATLLGPELAHAAVRVGEGANSHGSQAEWLFSLGLVLAAIIRRGGGGSRGIEDGQMGLGESPQGFARRRFFERLKAEGLAAPHQSLLGHLKERIPRSLPELGNLSGASIPIGQVAPALRELEEAGLVTSYSMDPQGRLFQITELGRQIHSLYHRFDRERLLKPLSRATIRRLGTGRWVSDKGLRDEVFSALEEADFEREMNMLTRVGLVDRRRHPSRFGMMEYRLSPLGTEVLGKDREVVAILERILSEFPEE